MPLRRLSALILLLLCIAECLLTSCLVRRRAVTRKGGSVKQTLLTATPADLIARIDAQYKAIDNLTATVDMVPAIGSVEKNKVTEYKDIRAYLLFRKPSDIRIIGLFPVVRNKAFDMVADATDFRLYIPAQARFITGRNEIIQPSKNKLENLRPQHFLDAVIVKPVQAGERPVLENYTDEENAAYIVHLIRTNPDDTLTMTRTIWFNRINLQMIRQIILDPAGNILTDARYDQWQNYDGVPFPKHIEVNRPRDEYGVVMTVVKMDINKGLTDDKFVLERPEGSKLQVLGQSESKKQ